MRNPQGYLTIVHPDAPTQEFDTFTCFHCQKIVPVRPKDDLDNLGAYCTVCKKMICSECHYKMSVLGQPCAPWEKQMDQMEARERALKSYGV